MSDAHVSQTFSSVQIAEKRYLRERGAKLFGPGHGWQSHMARAFGVDSRKIRAYLAEDGTSALPVPAWLLSAMRDGATARIDISIVGPKPGSSGADDRDEDAYQAMDPAMEALIRGAEKAGWTEPAILTAMLTILVEMMRTGAGIPATMETLKQCIDLLRAERDT